MQATRPIRIRRLLRQPVLFVWACYVLLTPLYVFSGGLPQPGDALIILVVPMALVQWNGRLPRMTVRTLRPLLLFTGWVVLVSVAWAVLLWEWGTNLLYPLYYIYNTAFFFVAVLLYQRFGTVFLRFTVQLVFVTVLGQVVASFAMVGSEGRNQLFFDNPNQLGYYALLAACMLAAAHRWLGSSLWASSVGMVCCGYLAVLSSSRSSVAGIAFLLVLLLFANPRILLVAALASVGFTLLDTPLGQSVETLQRRVSEKRNPDMTFFEQRGYDRIWRNKEHVLLGAAEGARWRWRESTRIRTAEIHSSAGTLLFSYGIPGVLLFGVFLVRVIRGVRIREGLLLLPPLFYSVAHQGLRFTMLWVLLALFVSAKEDLSTTRAGKATA
jgi:hypothetical protein